MQKSGETGGGTLIRTGTHPLSGMLWLKQQEADARGEKITVQSVFADCGGRKKDRLLRKYISDDKCDPVMIQ